MFDFANTKTHQEGIKNIDHPCHVCANPSEPVVFTVIALAWYIIAHPSILTGQRNLLERNSQYERFNKIFNEVVRTH